MQIIRSRFISDGTFNVPNPTNPNAPHPGHMFVIDPLAVTSNNQSSGFTIGLSQWPFRISESGISSPLVNVWNRAIDKNYNGNWDLKGGTWPCRRMNVNQIGLSVAETVFRLRDDLSLTLPEEADRPGQQIWSTDAKGNALARQYKGDYSWMVTIVPKSEAALLNLQTNFNSSGNHLYEVSVITFRKREVAASATSERMLAARMLLGNELVMFDSFDHDASFGAADAVDQAVDGIRPDNWVAVMGVHPNTGQFLMQWYRLLSIDSETNLSDPGGFDRSVPHRLAMLQGPDWPIRSTGSFEDNLRVVLLPNTVNVVTRQMKLGK